MGYSLSLKEAFIYNIDGRWESDSSLFKYFTLSLEGDKLSGQLEVRHPGLHDGRGHLYYNGYSKLFGHIKGSHISFQAKGRWSKSTSYQTVPFSVIFKGRVNKKKLFLRYEFEYPDLRRYPNYYKGEIRALRVEDQTP